jgi:hypothetical protein
LGCILAEAVEHLGLQDLHGRKDGVEKKKEGETAISPAFRFEHCNCGASLVAREIGTIWSCERTMTRAGGADGGTMETVATDETLRPLSCSEPLKKAARSKRVAFIWGMKKRVEGEGQRKG